MKSHRSPLTPFGAAALLWAALLPGCASTQPVPPPETGVITVKSPRPLADTVVRLEGELAKRKLAVLAKVSHSAAATQIGMSLRPTTELIFGNPQVGTPLMQCAQGVGIDLPMKALVWDDAAGQTWLTYNDPGWLVRRHGGGDCPAAAAVAKALAGLAEATVAP